MAALQCKVFHSILKISSRSSFCYLRDSCSKFYSVFAPDFREPIIIEKLNAEAVEKLSEEEIRGMKLKPTPSSAKSSFFYHPDVEKFINIILKTGDRQLAQATVDYVFTTVKHIQLRKYNSEPDPEKKKDILIHPLDVFLLAVKNVSPMMYFLKIKKSGTWYKIPVGISESKAKYRAMKWLVEVTYVRHKKYPIKDKLAQEIVNAANYEGQAIAKKLEIHKMCEANRGFANYWWT